MNLKFSIAILALSLQGLFVVAAEYDLANAQTSSKKLVVEHITSSGYHCHEDATCTAISPGLFLMQAQWRPHWDGITACHGPRGPKGVSNIMELKRSLQTTKRKKATGEEDDNPKREQKEPQHHTSGYFWHTKVHRKLTGNMKLTFTFAILALSLQGLLVAAADHDLTDEQAGTKTLEVDGIMCSDPCHKDATCTATDAGLFECKLQVQWRPHWGRSHRLQSASWSIGRFLHYGAQACS